MVRFTLITCHPLENKFSDYITSKHESGQTKLILDKEHKKVFQCRTDPHPTMFAENRSHTQWSVRLNYLEVQWHMTHATFLRIRPTVSDGWPLTGTEECHVTQKTRTFSAAFSMLEHPWRQPNSSQPFVPSVFQCNESYHSHSVVKHPPPTSEYVACELALTQQRRMSYISLTSHLISLLAN